jgi:hypothetical protein
MQCNAMQSTASTEAASSIIAICSAAPILMSKTSFIQSHLYKSINEYQHLCIYANSSLNSVQYTIKEYLLPMKRKIYFGHPSTKTT